MDKPADAQPAAERLARLAAAVQRMEEQLARVVVGGEPLLRALLAGFFAEGHCLLAGPGGTGRTFLARAVAKTLGMDLKIVVLHPALGIEELVGSAIFDPGAGQTRLRRGPLFNPCLLLDDLWEASPAVQATLRQALETHTVWIGSQPRALTNPFVLLATTPPLDDLDVPPSALALLDRFLIYLPFPYPEAGDEAALVERHHPRPGRQALDCAQVETVLRPETLLKVQTMAAAVHVDRRVVEYAVRIAREARAEPAVAEGASPRAGLALVRYAKALTLLDGRGFATPDDIKAAAGVCLPHRILPATDKEGGALARVDLIAEVLDRVAAPRL
jgi:MoxR-like ATPase